MHRASQAPAQLGGFTRVDSAVARKPCVQLIEIPDGIDRNSMLLHAGTVAIDRCEEVTRLADTHKSRLRDGAQIIQSPLHRLGVAAIDITQPHDRHRGQSDTDGDDDHQSQRTPTVPCTNSQSDSQPPALLLNTGKLERAINKKGGPDTSQDRRMEKIRK